MANHIVIGTRGSELALIQAQSVADAIRKGLGLESELRVVKTAGDRITDRPLREIEGSGFFTKELEETLLERRIDLAVHSLKDLPLSPPPGLTLAAVTARETAGDTLIINPEAFDPSIPPPPEPTPAAQERWRLFPLRMGARIGTSAVRRSTQLACIRPDLQFVELRGNVITRIEKLAQGNCNAILVATAGLRRLKLDLKAFHVLELDPTRFIPAPGQGALAVQVRGDSPYFSTLNRILNHEQTAKAVAWERGVLKVLGGGCGLPLGVYARHIDDRWELFGFWGGDIHHPVWSKVRGPEETA